MVKVKGPRNKGTRRIGNLMIRREKKLARHTKYVEVDGKLKLKPQWKDEDGKELEVSNKSNLLPKSSQ